MQLHGTVNSVTEWVCATAAADPAAPDALVVDVLVHGPDGQSWRVPAYWAGGSEWRVRFAPPVAGEYHFETVTPDAGSGGQGQSGTLRAAPYTGANPLLRHGALRVSADRRRFEHADGTPFLWLGDTWWMGFCQRWRWPEDFQLMTADRKAKGFSVIQIIAGLYPDMPAFDPRGANEAGFPWSPGFTQMNPAYFDMADLRIQWLVAQGLMPCIVGGWGYFLPWMGLDKMRRHWRCLIARWGAYPVTWCLAGEGTMPYYLTTDREGEAAQQKSGWTEMARYVRATDPCHRLITIHPSSSARDTVADDSVLDFDMLQTGHGGHDSIAPTLQAISGAVARQPHMPVVNGEVCYEGIVEGSREEIQRFMFWSNLLSGAAGFTYGANGIWQINGRETPYGPSPWGGAWGNRPWEEAYRLPGSAQIGQGKRFLATLPWWRFEAHPEWMTPHAESANWRQPFAAGIPRELRIVYLPGPVWPWGDRPKVTNLEDGVVYAAQYVDPKDGKEYMLGTVTGPADWTLPVTPVTQDWLLVLRRVS